MAKVAERQINNKAEAMAYANDLLGHFREEGAAPITIKYGYKKQRSLNQNAWYWKWLSDYVVPYFSENPVSMVQFILNKVVKFNITPELVHEMFKMVYNNGISTTRNDTKRMAEYCDSIRHDFLHDYRVHIPEPTISGYDDIR